MKLRLSLVVIVSFIFFPHLSTAGNGRKQPNKDDKTCTNSACKRAAQDLKRCMDTTVNPCENFYKFTCGRFLKETKIPDDKQSVTAYSETQNKLDTKLRAIFEKDCDDCPHYERYLKDYYKSCMNSSAINRDGEKAMLDMFREFGGWPLLDECWDESKADLTSIMTTMLKYQQMGLFYVFVNNDEANSSVHTIGMLQWTLPFPIDYYTDEKHDDKMDAFKTFITNVVKILSKRKRYSSKMETNVLELIEFEKKLSKIMYPPENARLLKQVKITLRSLADKFKVVNMTAIIEKLFGDVGIKIDGEELIAIYGLGYFDKLAKLLNETSKRTVINYLIWHMLNKLHITMPRKYESYKTDFEKVVSGVSGVEPRWKKCTSLVTTELYGPLGAVYAKAYFNKTDKNMVKNLTKELKKSFEGMIHNVQWLTNDTQSHAINKLNKMREQIGYPDHYDTDTDLFEELFDKIKGQSDHEYKSFLRKHLDFLAIVVDENYKLLRKADDFEKSDMDVAIINAYYSYGTNEIIFPAGILQWPYFSEDIPMYLNYGGIGTFIGHEITHGFDNKGHKYDETGTLHDWWKEEDKTNYAAASKCMAEMYSNFAVEELNETMNGNLTLGENIADNGGLRAAYKAYKIWKEKNGEEYKLPDLDFTPEQLFFINYGRISCEKIRPKAAARKIRESYHAPCHFRVIGTLMNMEEFSEVFNCKPKSPMNPEKKCRVW